MMNANLTVTAGRPWPMGATPDGAGVNFAIFSQHATRMTLCLFDAAGHETLLIELPENIGHVWHGHVEGLRAGQRYGFRAHGPYRPDEGHRFNAHKLLLDPYARRLTGAADGHPDWHDALMGYDVRSRHLDLVQDTRDSARYMPKCVVVDDDFDWQGDAPPARSMSDTIFYEAHAKGLTANRTDIENAGTYAAMASPQILEHLTKLGVTAVELLPVQAFLDDRHLVEKNLRNYWGYMTTGFFAPEPRYRVKSPDGRGEIAEFQEMVRRFHSAGIEVILDVVYNHTSEGNQLGPTLSFRGLDNMSYYRLAENPRYYINDSGTGNTLNLNHPMVLRMVMDSLRYWVDVMHVDGFRFDLASALGRTENGFDRQAPFFQAIRQDPVLGRVKLVAEPWDTGPGGYQLGAYPAPWGEWNDKYRDQVRGFWRGDRDMTRKLAQRLSGSALRFDHDRRPATSSVNLLTAHDGFTLMDVVSYTEKHNEANGEDNADGHDHNISDNMGTEGPTGDAAITAARARRRRNMMATLLLSQGTPLILAGDEMGNTQGGNNNAYAQDNPTGWVDWPTLEDGQQGDAARDFVAFCARLTALRHAHPILRQTRFLHARSRLIDGRHDLVWRTAQGTPMADRDWFNPDLRAIAAEVMTASGSPDYARSDHPIYLIFNAGDALTATLPAPQAGLHWTCHIDTADPRVEPAGRVPSGDTYEVAARSVVVLLQEPAPPA